MGGGGGGGRGGGGGGGGGVGLAFHSLHLLPSPTIELPCPESPEPLSPSPSAATSCCRRPCSRLHRRHQHHCSCTESHRPSLSQSPVPVATAEHVRAIASALRPFASVSASPARVTTAAWSYTATRALSCCCALVPCP